MISNECIWTSYCILCVFGLIAWFNPSILMALSVCFQNAKKKARPADVSFLMTVYVVVWFQGVFGINSTSNISKLTVIFGKFLNIKSGIYAKISKFMPNTLNKPCCYLFII